MDGCVQGRDWGKYERHEDHWPTRTPEASDRLSRRLAEEYDE